MTATNDATATDGAPATAAIDDYIAVWNETDEATRKQLIRSALGADLWYRDPNLEADGHDAFSKTVAYVQENFPGHVMRRTSEVGTHHDLARFNWALGVPGQTPALAGVDVAKYDGDGRLHRIIGFAGESLPTTDRA